MREKQIEQKLIKAVRSAGGIAPKLVSPGFDGMPDRMVLMPGGHIGFVVVQHIVTEGTIDEQILCALKNKDKTQTALIEAVKANLRQ